MFITTIGKVGYSIVPFAILLMLFIFSFTILGLETFANKLRFNLDDELIPYFAEDVPNTSATFSIPDSNFDTFGNAIVSVFIVMTGDEWARIYHNCYRAVGGT
jgi:hypothetical protein